MNQFYYLKVQNKGMIGQIKFDGIVIYHNAKDFRNNSVAIELNNLIFNEENHTLSIDFKKTDANSSLVISLDKAQQGQVTSTEPTGQILFNSIKSTKIKGNLNLAIEPLRSLDWHSADDLSEKDIAAAYEFGKKVHSFHQRKDITNLAKVLYERFKTSSAPGTFVPPIEGLMEHLRGQFSKYDSVRPLPPLKDTLVFISKNKKVIQITNKNYETPLSLYKENYGASSTALIMYRKQGQYKLLGFSPSID